ncbi:hypothetical protein BSL78_24605 [Apostichopus japonicus]|uniref:Caspase recruitment domain-containing protein n=1 Tax=Stichopus japonicus TaxID=307972 RepID=A0A2G8JS33_STIJA|nr:hypothetical protein BSL78_24605 [Apostichopus japonicus]
MSRKSKQNELCSRRNKRLDELVAEFNRSVPTMDVVDLLSDILIQSATEEIKCKEEAKGRTAANRLLCHRIRYRKNWYVRLVDALKKVELDELAQDLSRDEKGSLIDEISKERVQAVSPNTASIHYNWIAKEVEFEQMVQYEKSSRSAQPKEISREDEDGSALKFWKSNEDSKIQDGEKFDPEKEPMEKSSLEKRRKTEVKSNNFGNSPLPNAAEEKDKNGKVASLPFKSTEAVDSPDFKPKNLPFDRNQTDQVNLCSNQQVMTNFNSEDTKRGDVDEISTSPVALMGEPEVEKQPPSIKTNRPAMGSNAGFVTPGENPPDQTNLKDTTFPRNEMDGISPSQNAASEVIKGEVEATLINSEKITDGREREGSVPDRSHKDTPRGVEDYLDTASEGFYSKADPQQQRILQELGLLNIHGARNEDGIKKHEETDNDKYQPLRSSEPSEHIQHMPLEISNSFHEEDLSHTNTVKQGMSFPRVGV